MSAPAAPQVAIPFILFNDESKQYEVSPGAISVLEGLPDSVGVIVVAGRYRSGKSFLMNQLVRADVMAGEGFGIGHTIASHTKGIWMWPTPVRARTSSGDAVDVIVMDSEGLGATEATEHRDTEIFSLSTLLCSVLMFNCQRTIDEASIQTLGFIANLTKHIRLKASSDAAASAREDTLEEYQQFLPSFVWIIRDFALQLEDADGPDAYMESALAQQPGFDKETVSRNRIRKSVTNFFTDRKCVTLIVPTDAEDKLQSLDKQPESALRPQFREQMDELRRMLFEHARAKTVGGRPVNGPMLIALAQSYVAAINSGGVPNIGDAWESAARTQCDKLARDCIRQYESSLNPADASCAIGHFPIDENVLRDAHASTQATVLALFDRLAPTAPAVTTVFRKKIEVRTLLREFVRAQASTSAYFQDLLKDNIAASRAASESSWRELRKKHVLPCVEALQSALAAASKQDPASPRILDELSAHTCMNSVWSTWLALRDEYLAKPSGPSGLHTLLTSAFDKFSVDLLDVARSIDVSIAAVMKAMLSSLKEQHDVVTGLRDTISHRESDANALQSKLAAAASQLSAKQDELATSAAELLALKSSFGASKSEIESIRLELSRVSLELSDKSSSLIAANASAQQLSREVDSVSGQLRESKAAEAAYQSTISELRSVSDRQRADLEDVRRHSLAASTEVATLTQTQANLTKELQVARVQLQDAQSALAAEQADSKHLRDKLKMAQSEAGLGKVQLETMTADLESAKRTTERLRTELQESRAHALQVVSDTDSLQQALRESKAQLAVVTSEAQQSLQSISLLQSEVAELKEALAMARKDFSSQQAQLASVTRDWEGAADDITKWKRAAQEAKDASDRYSKRIVDLTAEYEAERRKAFDFEGKLQVAARFESRYESERERSAELQARLLELTTQEAAWRTERLQLADLSAKLESARAEINQEREGNVDLRRKLASQRELEFDLRAEKDRRQAVEAKLVEAEKQAAQAHGAVTEIARLKHDKQMIADELDSLKSELHRTRSVVLDFKEQSSQADVNAREKSVQYELRIQQLSHDLSESSAALEKERTFRATSDLVIAELKKQLGHLKFDAFKVEELKSILQRERDMLVLKQQALQRTSDALPVVPSAEEVDRRELKLLEREIEASRLQIDEQRLALVKAHTEVEMLKREVEQARLQRKALRASVQRWTDEASHEKASRAAAEALLRAAAGFGESVAGASDGTLNASQQQQLRELLESV